MSLQSESTLAELQRAGLHRGAAERGRADGAMDHQDHGRVPGIDEDAAAEAVKRSAPPIMLAVLAVIAVAVVALGTWSWFGAA